MPGLDVARVSIRGMVIVFDALGARNELGAKLPETAESWSSLYFINRPYGRPDGFYTVFHHAHYFSRDPCGSTVRVTFSNRDLQERCLRTL